MSRDDKHRKHQRKQRRRAERAEAERRQRLGLPLHDSAAHPERAARDPSTRWRSVHARGGLELRFTPAGPPAPRPHLHLVYDADLDEAERGASAASSRIGERDGGCGLDAGGVVRRWGKVPVSGDR